MPQTHSNLNGVNTEYYVPPQASSCAIRWCTLLGWTGARFPHRLTQIMNSTFHRQLMVVADWDPKIAGIVYHPWTPDRVPFCNRQELSLLADAARSSSLRQCRSAHAAPLRRLGLSCPHRQSRLRLQREPREVHIFQAPQRPQAAPHLQDRSPETTALGTQVR